MLTILFTGQFSVFLIYKQKVDGLNPSVQAFVLLGSLLVAKGY
jgi:hypothetical protein